MRRFLKYTGLFIAPLIIILFAIEGLLRHIPNDYHYKKEFLAKNGESLQVLFLGSSQAYYGINPEYISVPSFNEAEVAQTLDLDWELLKINSGHLKNLKILALPISYFSFNLKIIKSMEAKRIAKYNIYYGMRRSINLLEYTELFTTDCNKSINKLFYYFHQDSTDLHCNKWGWGTKYDTSHKENLEKTAIRAIEVHNYRNPDDSLSLAIALDSIVSFCNQKKIFLLLYTPPVSKIYLDKLNKKQLAEMYEHTNIILTMSRRVTYIDFTKDPSFSGSDFYDADHLNHLGAKKLSQKIDSVINTFLSLDVRESATKK